MCLGGAARLRGDTHLSSVNIPYSSCCEDLFSIFVRVYAQLDAFLVEAVKNKHSLMYEKVIQKEHKQPNV